VEYKNPVHISQDTHHFFATEPSQLMLCKILGFHGGAYEECNHLGCDTVWLHHQGEKIGKIGTLSAVTSN
jgi:hypothetical protein